MIENVDERTPYELAYEEAVRALSQQQSVLDNFRTRADRDRSFGLIGTCALAILWPRRDWEFVAGPRRLIATYIESEDPLPLPEIYRDLALHMEDSYDENSVRLQ